MSNLVSLEKASLQFLVLWAVKSTCKINYLDDYSAEKKRKKVITSCQVLYQPE